MKGNWLSRFLRNRDSFGHTLQLVYKGRETYNSIIGGIFTLLMQGLTLVMVIYAVQNLFIMTDPVILNYTKPLTPQDKSKLVPLKFDDYDYVIAF